MEFVAMGCVSCFTFQSFVGMMIPMVRAFAIWHPSNVCFYRNRASCFGVLALSNMMAPVAMVFAIRRPGCRFASLVFLLWRPSGVGFCFVTVLSRAYIRGVIGVLSLVLYHSVFGNR